MDEKMIDALNSQVNAEMYSSYLYLSMGSYFESEDMSGFANWMRVQAQEELVHAMKIYDFIIQRGDKVTLTRIDSPPTEWKSALDVFEHVYAPRTKGHRINKPAGKSCNFSRRPCNKQLLTMVCFRTS